MIPKIIHYCWFGGNPLPELAKECIASWCKCMPNWELKAWTEENFDIQAAPQYVQEAYQVKKYNNVSHELAILFHKFGSSPFLLQRLFNNPDENNSSGLLLRMNGSGCSLSNQ